MLIVAPQCQIDFFFFVKGRDGVKRRNEMKRMEEKSSANFNFHHRRRHDNHHKYVVCCKHCRKIFERLLQLVEFVFAAFRNMSLDLNMCK